MNVIALPFAFLMRIFNQLTGSYAIALLLFALLVKIIMLPLSIKQQKTQIRTAKLRPKLAAIERKYAGRTDRKTLEKKQQEIMELQQKEGVSPLGGCLPLLIQLPIILILYGVVQNPLTHICQFSETTISALRAVAESNGLAKNATQISIAARPSHLLFSISFPPLTLLSYIISERFVNYFSILQKNLTNPLFFDTMLFE